MADSSLRAGARCNPLRARTLGLALALALPSLGLGACARARAQALVALPGAVSPARIAGEGEAPIASPAPLAQAPVEPDPSSPSSAPSAAEPAEPAPAEPAPEALASAAPADPIDPHCPADMAYVSGQYCSEADQDCLEWSDDDRHRCLRFREPSRCDGRRRRMGFCMDRFEWPNRRGERPAVMVDWNHAAAQCESRGRRLCTQDEWTFACEGEDMLPYPYGYSREEGACVVDHFARAPVRALLHSTRPGVAEAEAERVYEALPSGSAPRCRSPFGVYDLVGSVDEWTVNESGVPFHSALKGGWWGRIRGRCRPATLAHNERFRYYQIGFRCCAASSDGGVASR